MRCLYPRTVGFKSDGKTIAWSEKDHSKQFASFQLPCSRCIECRLEQARDKAVRCTHEARMYGSNSFITLTYSEDNLRTATLNYRDFQLFMKKLRFKAEQDHIKNFGESKWLSLSREGQKTLKDQWAIPMVVTGEYGDKTKRPHWHALIFNWRPLDAKYKYTTDLGDKVYQSQELTDLWGNGIAEFGNITFKSAGYVCRYATKKLVHGKDQEHNYQPIHRMSSKHAIGKKFLEKYYKDIFTHGYVVLDNGTRTTIPRYYEKWFQKHYPKDWESYVTQIKLPKTAAAAIKTDQERQDWLEEDLSRATRRSTLVRSQEIRKTLSQKKFKRLQQHLKGDH